MYMKREGGQVKSCSDRRRKSAEQRRGGEKGIQHSERIGRRAMFYILTMLGCFLYV